MALVTVIGAANMDICGKPEKELVMRDSNPGTVSLSAGGVGRNIAHDLCLLGLDVRFIAALGDDEYGSLIRKGCESVGMDMSLCLTVAGARTSTYLYVTDGRGDMLAAVSDMDIVKKLTPEVLSSRMDALNASDAVVIEANLPAETIAYIAEHCTAPLYADPVSTAKAPKLLAVLPRLRAIKPNDAEACMLTGESDASAAAERLAALGVQRVFVSCGSAGMLACGEGETIRKPCRFGKTVNTTGAGDSAVAAIVWADVMGFDLEKTLDAAQLAGAITVADERVNSPALQELPHSLPW